MSSKASSGAPLGLADVDRQPRLVAGPVEVDRVGGAAAAADRQVEAGEAVVELAREAGGGAGEALVVLGRDDHGDLGRRLAVRRRRQRARGQRAQRPHAPGSAPGPATRPSARRAAPRAAISTPAPRLEVGAELGGAGDDVAAVGHLAGRARRRRRRPPPPRSPTPASASAPAPAPAASSPCARSPGPAAALAR